MARTIQRKNSRVADTIYVRVDPELKTWLNTYADGLDTTEKHVVEQVLRYFKSLPEEMRKDVLHDPNSFFAAFGTLLELMAWADHAFQLKHVEWALEAYQKLVEKTVHIPGLQRLAQYKLGYCWLDQAISVRRELIQSIEDTLNEGVTRKKGRNSRTDAEIRDSQWRDSLAAADEAVCMSIYHNHEFLKLKGHHPVVRFNLACAWSLRCQYAVEKRLGWKEWMPTVEEGSMRTQGDAATQPTDYAALDEERWRALGDSWRSLISPQAAPTDQGDSLVNEVKLYAGHAKNELEQMLKEPVGDEGADAQDDLPFISREGLVLPGNVGFLIRKASTDADLLFMRYDEMAKKSFDEWTEKGEGEESRLKSQQRLGTKRIKEFNAMRETIRVLMKRQVA